MGSEDANPTKINGRVLQQAVADIPLKVQVVVGRPSDLAYDMDDVNRFGYETLKDGQLLLGIVTGLQA